jgi:hypothetical protein
MYEAGEPGWLAPGPNYVRVGTSGTRGVPDPESLGLPGTSLGAGLPLYARFDEDPSLIRTMLRFTGGTP